MKRSAALLAAAVLGAFPAVALADAGDAAANAVAAVAARAFWKKPGTRTEHGPAGAEPVAGGPVAWTWERDRGDEEWRYVVETSPKQSVSERFERSTSAAGYNLVPGQPEVKAAFSAAAVADYANAKPAGTVRSDKLGLTQTFYRGKRWGFILSVSDPGQHGSRNLGLTEEPVAGLSASIAAARGCAKTGECGE